MDLIKSINDHLKLQEMCLLLSHKILKSCQSDDIDLLISLIDNRERLLSTLAHLFQNIDYELNQLPASAIGPELIDFLKEWQSKMINLSQEITNLDQEVVVTLEQSKDSIALEISKIFKQKENLKGYDLSTVKR